VVLHPQKLSKGIGQWSKIIGREGNLIKACVVERFLDFEVTLLMTQLAEQQSIRSRLLEG
jgi:hypothetical protein